VGYQRIFENRLLVYSFRVQGTWVPLPDLEDAVELFVIYDHPLDFPEHFVVRRWFVVGVDQCLPDYVPRIAGTLEDARGYVPDGLVHMVRRRGEDAFIIETWMTREWRSAVLLEDSFS